MPTPEALAREEIDAALAESGWCVQDPKAINLSAGRGVAVREFELKPGYGTADYMLFADSRPVGVVEAKSIGTTLTGVEIQTTRYSDGLPDWLDPWSRPLAMLYESTGRETRFTNRLDPEPRSRRVFALHRPATLRDWSSPSIVGLPDQMKMVAENPPVWDPQWNLRCKLRFFAKGRQTTNLASLNLTKLSALPVPVPLSEEQQRIAAEGERQFSLIDSQDRLAIVGLARAERLRQSIRKRAFGGKLVPQGPSDESATV